MKEFDHPNVMRLIGEGGADLGGLQAREDPSLWHWEGRTSRLPVTPSLRGSKLSPPSLPQFGM